MYRALTVFYPSRFRREYRDSMVQLFADRAQRDGVRRAWGGAVRDVVVSAPYEHWENVMHGSPQTKLTVAVILTSTAAITFILFGGALVGLALLLAVAWELTAILRVRGHRFGDTGWWKLLAAGAGLFALLFVVFAGPWPEDWRASVDGEVAWVVGMFGFATSLVLIMAGALMGAAHWASRRRLTG